MVPAFRTCTPKGPSGNKGQVSPTSVLKSGAEAVPSVMATEIILAVRDAVVTREQAPRIR